MTTGCRRSRARRSVGHSGRNEVGSGTLLALSAAMLVLAVAAAAAFWTVASGANHRAAIAADLAALSAAGSHQAGETEPCRTAARIAMQHAAEMSSCELEGETVLVVVAVRLRLGGLGAPSARASARSGPIGQG
jgi:secretion/DNA translocation related TadE-like protein